ncbi:MAG: PQQ-binding-like beta-propeller repeat protein, partial [Calditrichota bacterium]
LWANSYLAGGSIRPLAAVADKQEGLIITSGLTFPDGGSDAVLMKYSSQGELQWDYTYSPAGIQQSSLNTLYSDEAGNIYAGGYSSAIGLSEMHLVKLSPDGQTLWSKKFDSTGGDDFAVGICALPNNTICLGGNSFSEDNDLRFISVSSDGEVIWEQQINFSIDDHLVAIAPSSSGLVATAYSKNEGSSDTKIFQLNTDGDLMWASDFPDNYNTYPTDIAVDHSGNSLIVGYREIHAGASGIIAAKYNSTGDMLWSEVLEYFGDSHHEGRAVAVGKNGEIFLSGYGFSAENGWDMLTYSLNSTGNRIWLDALNAPETSRERGVTSALDAEENLISLSNSFSGANGWDVLVTKHTSNGELLWNHRIDHCGTDDEAIDLLISNDNIFILSQAISDQDLLIGIITRLSVNSGEVFRQELPGISGWNFRPECLDAATDETLYVAATEYQGGNSSGVIISFNESGSVNWRYVSSENPHDELASVTALAVNDSYIAVGGTIPGSGISQKVGITLLNSSGQFNWQEQYQGNSGYLDELNDLAFRYDSAVVFAATVYNNGYNRDILAGCYATDGSLLWLDELNGSGNNNDLACGLNINSSGE